MKSRSLQSYSFFLAALFSHGVVGEDSGNINLETITAAPSGPASTHPCNACGIDADTEYPEWDDFYEVHPTATASLFSSVSSSLGADFSDYKIEYTYVSARPTRTYPLPNGSTVTVTCCSSYRIEHFSISQIYTTQTATDNNFVDFPDVDYQCKATTTFTFPTTGYFVITPNDKGVLPTTVGGVPVTTCFSQAVAFAPGPPERTKTIVAQLVVDGGQKPVVRPTYTPPSLPGTGGSGAGPAPVVDGGGGGGGMNTNNQAPGGGPGQSMGGGSSSGGGGGGNGSNSGGGQGSGSSSGSGSGGGGGFNGGGGDGGGGGGSGDGGQSGSGSGTGSGNGSSGGGASSGGGTSGHGSGSGSSSSGSGSGSAGGGSVNGGGGGGGSGTSFYGCKQDGDCYGGLMCSSGTCQAAPPGYTPQTPQPSAEPFQSMASKTISQRFGSSALLFLGLTAVFVTMI